MVKTRKTLAKRIKITKNGKILKKQNRTGHLKRKWNASKKNRKTGLESVKASGYIKKIKTLFGKGGSKIS